MPISLHSADIGPAIDRELEQVNESEIDPRSTELDVRGSDPLSALKSLVLSQTFKDSKTHNGILIFRE